MFTCSFSARAASGRLRLCVCVCVCVCVHAPRPIKRLHEAGGTQGAYGLDDRRENGRGSTAVLSASW
jgi:hypothetical protein